MHDSHPKFIAVNSCGGLRKEKVQIINSGSINMTMMNQKGKPALHALIVPYPIQGHVNTLMNLAQLIFSRFIVLYSP